NAELAGSASAPLGWTAGLLVGLILALLISPPADSANAAPPLAAFLLAALAGRWLLLGFSFPTHAPDLLFWTLAGLILAQTPATAAPAPVDLPLLHLAGIALALFGFSLSASGGASILLWLAALILLLAAAHVLARNDHEIRRTWHTLILPPLTLLPAIPLNRSAGLSAELAYGWLLLWLAGQAIWLIAPPARRRLTPALLATLPVLALLNLPVFGDIAYKTAILSPNDATARSAAMRRAFTLSPHDHVLAAGIVPTENLSLPADATLDPPQARRITGLYDRALAAQPLAPETAAAYAEWLRQRAAVDAAAHAPALDMFTRALALSPNDIQTRNRQALLLADQAALRALIDLDPLYGPAYLHLATLQQQNGDLAAARSTLQTGIANVPWWDALPRALAALP
ncbi:MAG: hypothetical protein HUU23_18540, partial [Caldilineales bacterium]|nr:hypothetical protein [Caldilineales bacterium]